VVVQEVAWALLGEEKVREAEGVEEKDMAVPGGD
jgi:hypothetical protein